MKLLKKTAIIISLLTSTTGFAFADGHEAPGSGYWSTVSQELKEGKSGTILYTLILLMGSSKQGEVRSPNETAGNERKSVRGGLGMSSFPGLWPPSRCPPKGPIKPGLPGYNATS